MKETKTILLLALILSVSLLMGQKQVSGVKQLNPINFMSPKTPNDTLMPASFLTGTPTLYLYSQGGYITGTNGCGDQAKAQLFNVTSPCNIEGCLVWVGAKEIVGTANTVRFVVYTADGPGIGNACVVNTAPGFEQASIEISMNDLDTSSSITSTLDGAHVFMLSSPLYVTTDYYVGMDFTNTYDDILGIVSTTDGDAGGTELAWERGYNNNWFSILSSWDIDIDLAFFPIIYMCGIGIQTEDINGVIFNVVPNPAYGLSKIEYELTNPSSNVEIKILDVTGKIVKCFNEGAKEPGKYNVTFNASELQPGNYFYTIYAGNGRQFAKKFQVE